MPGANSPKYRDYMITANQGAECYEHFLEIIKELEPKLYAVIVHDKDVELKTEADGSITETPKKVHKHAVIECRNPLSFEGMKNRFKGAHIENPHYKKSAYQYLIHNSPNSKEKYQYPLEDIISNNLEQVKLIIETETEERFFPNMVVRYIAQGTTTAYGFYKRFGLDAYKSYWGAYRDMLENLQRDPEMQKDFKEQQRILLEEPPF